MTLFESFIRRPVGTIMLNTALLVFGLLGLQRLPVRELPDIDPSVVNVLTVYPGANAEVVETEVTDRLEEAISSADSIKLITSESREQVSSITVEFVQGRNVDMAAQDVRDRVARVRGLLPSDIEDPVVVKQDSGARPIMWIAFFSDEYDVEALTHLADTQVKDRLQTVPGVSSVIIGGEKKRAIRIWLDAQKMAAHQVTVLDIANTLHQQNIELPSGRVENTNREFTVRTFGELQTAEAFNRLILREEGTRMVRLEDVGRAELGVEDERGRARFNGRPAVGLGVVRQSKANTLSVAKGIKDRMAAIIPELPEGIEVEFPYDESVFIQRAVTEVWQTLGIAFILVILTVFLFLRNIRATLIPAIAIPVSIGTTFGILYVLGLSINIFTLLALVLAIGILVDDAIVVLENIHRHVDEGMMPFEAAILGIKEIAFAVITTTLSLVAVFLPLVFIGGITGRLLFEFAVALAASVMCSSIVALTLSPMAGARILKPATQTKHGSLYHFFEHAFDRVQNRYERTLNWSLRHRGAVMLVALLSLGLSFYFFSNLDQEFLPEEDKGRLLTMTFAPEGSTPEYTDRMMRHIESILEDEKSIRSYFSAVALPFAGPGNPTLGFSFVRLQPGKRPHVRDIVGGPHGLGARMFGEVEGSISVPIMPKAVDIAFRQPFQIVVTNPDLSALNAFTKDLTSRFQQEGFLSNPRATFQINKPELNIHIDRDRAAALGVSIRDLSRTLQNLFAADAISTFKRDGKQYNVIAQLDRQSRMTPDTITQQWIRNSSGNLIQLENLIRLEEATGPTVIERYNRQRSATIEATPAGIPLGMAITRTEAIMKEMLPAGFGYQWKGEAQDLKESSSDIYQFMLLAIIVVYMVLAAQFESFSTPFVVLLALPLALVGAFGLLYALSWVNHFGTMMYGWAHYAPDPPAIAGWLSMLIPRISSMNINIFSQVGLILLIGMVTKNSILLVEFANKQRNLGFAPIKAMLNAGLIRLRPILMTSLSTIAGILPIAIGFGDAAESRRPLGVVAVGGMITSTFLTLYVIPVMYTLLAEWSEARRSHSRTAKPPPRDPVAGEKNQVSKSKHPSPAGIS